MRSMHTARLWQIRGRDSHACLLCMKKTAILALTTTNAMRIARVAKNAHACRNIRKTQLVPGSHPGVPSCMRISSPQPRPSTCTHVDLTRTVTLVCGMHSQTAPPACMPARSTFSLDDAPANAPSQRSAQLSRCEIKGLGNVTQKEDCGASQSG